MNGTAGGATLATVPHHLHLGVLMAGRKFTPNERIERFWSKVQTGGPSECWPWIGYRSPEGYGQIWDGEKTIGAYRFAWQLIHGPLPAGKELDHLCRNRACVNPSHLELVTGVENILRSDCPPARNARKSKCPQGHAYATRLYGPKRKIRGRGSYRYCPICESNYAKAYVRAPRNRRTRKAPNV